MSKISRLAALALASSCLTACASSSPVEVHVPTPVLPPAQYLAYCHEPNSDGTIGGELSRLNALVLCERGGKDAIRAWAQGITK